ncbi:hypothetical protein Peur_028409 [Populus x canadensis]
MMHKRLFKHTEKCPWNIEMLARAINARAPWKQSIISGMQGHQCKVIGKVRTCKPYVVLLACQLLTSGLYSWCSSWICDWDCYWLEVTWNRTYLTQNHWHCPILSCNSTGVFRPHKDSKYRPFFNWFHSLVDCSALILSSFNIFIGFGILHAANF